MISVYITREEPIKVPTSSNQNIRGQGRMSKARMSRIQAPKVSDNSNDLSFYLLCKYQRSIFVIIL